MSDDDSAPRELTTAHRRYLQEQIDSGLAAEPLSDAEWQVLKERMERGEHPTAVDIARMAATFIVLKTREDQLERQRRAQRARAERGAYTGGHTPYGFTWDEASQKWRPAGLEYHILLEIKLLRDQGRGYHAIAEELNRRGIPTAKGATKWRGPSVERILKNPFYQRVLGW